MKDHELKTDPIVFDDIKRGHKTFELRKDDRDYMVGDRLVLRQTAYSLEEMQKGSPFRYTGDYLIVKVKYILYGPAYGLLDGWCIMSIELCEDKP